MVVTLLMVAVSSCSGPAGSTVAPPTTTAAPVTVAPPSTSAPSVTTSTPPTTVTATTPPKRVVRPVPHRPAAQASDPLTGLKPDGGPVIAAKIDNTSAGYPQFGVAAADVVYIEQVEGGLTRLIAVFHTALPTEVGPIRSVRSTDAELLSTYGKPGLAFSGGAGGPLTALAATRIANLSPDRHGSAYWRSKFGDGTHNLHVDLQSLAATGAGALGPPQSVGFTFAANDPALAAAASATSIEVTMQAGRTGFTYAKGRYVVRHKDSPYVDHDGTAVLTQNVLVQSVHDEPDGTVDSVGSPSFLSHTIGTGKFILFRDGRQIQGIWKRAVAAGPTSYLDSAGKPVLFKPGKTWVVLTPQSAQLTIS